MQMVQLEDVSKMYRLDSTEVHALKRVNITIEKGDFMVILGPSGSDKTTLLNLIGGIDVASSGRIIVNGTQVSSLREKDIVQYRRDMIGFVFQFFNLIPTLTARENIELAGELMKKPLDTKEILEKVGLGEKADRFPGELSGGEQQRVAIARALVKNPPILLCDEPIGELDFETGKRVLSLIRKINIEEKKTVILVTHNTVVGGIADRIIRLRSGEIVYDKRNENPGKPEELVW